MIEYKLLIGNIEEMIAVHKTLESNLEEESPSKKSPREQRLGKVLLANGIAIKAVHLIYWSNHPRAVSILEKYRDALDIYMENQGAPTPGLMTLTTGKLGLSFDKKSQLISERFGKKSLKIIKLQV